MRRSASVIRTTKETAISLRLVIDGAGKARVATGNGFFDHMLTLWSRHGLFDLELSCKGDTHVDFHHSAEDIGICLGQAFKKALRGGAGVQRYATAHAPMDSALARVCVDLSGRPNLVYEVTLRARKVNTFECELVEDFLKAFTDHAACTVHVDLLRGRSAHHALEAVFKALGQALAQACAINPRAPHQIPSTKGVL